jgi:uncharacterized protein (TIGR01244 family)
MKMFKVTDNYFVSPQISANDIDSIAAAGFKAVVCNRPDTEVQPSHQAAAIEQAARAAGLEFYILPLTHQTMTADIVAQQMSYSRMNGPVLAYCASGTRCTVAWSMGSASEGTDIDTILAAAQAAGYQLEGLRPTLATLASQD